VFGLMLSLSCSQSLTYTAPLYVAHGTELTPAPFGLVPQQHPMNQKFVFLGDQISNWHLQENDSNQFGDEGMNNSDNHFDVVMEESSQTQSFSIFDLPDEIMTYIFRYLDTKSFSRASGVCTYWRKLAASPWLWWTRSNVLWDHMLFVSLKNIFICDEILFKHLLE
jgi:hypothetical protein